MIKNIHNINELKTSKNVANIKGTIAKYLKTVFSCIINNRVAIANKKKNEFAVNEEYVYINAGLITRRSKKKNVNFLDNFTFSTSAKKRNNVDNPRTIGIMISTS